MAQDLKQAPSRPWNGPVVPYAVPDAPDASLVFFSNLSADPANLYDFDAGGYYVFTAVNPIFPGFDQNIAVPFTALVNGHVRTIQVALHGDVDLPGTPKCTLGIYNDDGTGIPGTPIIGASKTVTVPAAAPNALITVKFPGTGVAVTAHTHYWLVAKPIDDASDFVGIWAFCYPRFGFEQNGGEWFVPASATPAFAVKGSAP